MTALFIILIIASTIVLGIFILTMIAAHSLFKKDSKIFELAQESKEDFNAEFESMYKTAAGNTYNSTLNIEDKKAIVLRSLIKSFILPSIFLLIILIGSIVCLCIL